MTNAEEFFITFLFLGGIVLILYGLELLRQKDKQVVLDNKCPPHEWEWITEREMEDVNGYRGYLECAKCNRRPNGLQDRGWGTWPTFPAV